MNHDLGIAISGMVGSAVKSMSGVSGGDVAQAYRVGLADGRTVFAKTKPDAPADFFATEAAGLSWLAEPRVVRVPKVLAVSDDPPVLVLEWIEPGRPTAQTEPALGRALAKLHRFGADSFGRTDRARTGSLGLPNDPFDTWAEAYGANRLIPLARIGVDRGSFDATVAAALDGIADRLDKLVPVEPAARLHGDLWAGNRMVDAQGRSWLIDPAAHGGHREFDLAMMLLFGGFDERCVAAYDQTYPLTDGWRDRVPLHQLAPLAVHAIKFGGHYGAALRRALDSVVP